MKQEIYIKYCDSSYIRKRNFSRLSDCNERIRQKLIFLRHGPSRAWVLLVNRALWVMSLIYNLVLHVVSHSRSAPAQLSAACNGSSSLELTEHSKINLMGYILSAV